MAWFATTTSGRATTSPRYASTWRRKRIAHSKATPSACASAMPSPTLPARAAPRLALVETPPGPPVLASVVAEITGRPDNSYEDLLQATQTVRARLAAEPGVVDVDDTHEAAMTKLGLRDGQRKSRDQRNFHAAGRRDAFRCRRGHLRRHASRPRRAQSAANRIAPARCRKIKFGRPGPRAGQRQRGQPGHAGRNWAMGNAKRGHHHLPQEPATDRLRVRRNRGPAAGGCRCRYSARPIQDGEGPRGGQGRRQRMAGDQHAASRRGPHVPLERLQCRLGRARGNQRQFRR